MSDEQTVVGSVQFGEATRMVPPIEFKLRGPAVVDVGQSERREAMERIEAKVDQIIDKLNALALPPSTRTKKKTGAPQVAHE